MRIGSRGPAVLQLEVSLQELGYLQGLVPDELFDQDTEEAVRQFQQSNGLTVNGVATVQTQAILYSNNATYSLGENQAIVRTNDGSDAIAFTGPGIEYDLAGFIPDGTIVVVTGNTENNWYELEDGNWLEGSFLLFNRIENSSTNESGFLNQLREMFFPTPSTEGPNRRNSGVSR
ncbi:MAG: peptidoglycan-binding protein [Cyanobacteria bacterium P01_A01_bin.137]